MAARIFFRSICPFRQDSELGLTSSLWTWLDITGGVADLGCCHRHDPHLLIRLPAWTQTCPAAADTSRDLGFWLAYSPSPALLGSRCLGTVSHCPASPQELASNPCGTPLTGCPWHRQALKHPANSTVHTAPHVLYYGWCYKTFWNCL